jgi:hypothetical protein
LLHSISLSLPSLHCQKRMLLALLRSLQRKIYVPWLKATVRHDTGGQISHRSHPFDVVLSQDLCNHFCYWSANCRQEVSCLSAKLR